MHPVVSTSLRFRGSKVPGMQAEEQIQTTRNPAMSSGV